MGTVIQVLNYIGRDKMLLRVTGTSMEGSLSSNQLIMTFEAGFWVWGM